MTGMITTEIGMVGIIAIRGIGTVMSEETGTIGTTVTGIKTEALLLIINSGDTIFNHTWSAE
jgi:hypothetical protein